MGDHNLIDKELKKQVGAIRVSNPVGLLARKIWNVLLVNAYDDLLKENEFTISKNTLAEAIGFNSNDTKALLWALDKLQTTFVEWDIWGHSLAKGVSFNEFSKVQMLGWITVKKGHISYDYSPKLKNILYNPIIYQKISISQQKVFNTAYGLYLWENCLRFIGTGSTGFSSVEEWRRLLWATTKSYTAFKIFKASVLTPAINEVNNLTNIHITLKTQKIGRKISSIGFDVVENKQKQFFVSDGVEDIKSSAEYKKLKQYWIEEVKAITLLQEYGYKYINEKIRLTKDQHNIKNPSGFLLNSILKDWKDSNEVLKKSLKDKEDEQKKVESAKKIKDRKEAEVISINKDKKRKIIEDYLNDLDKISLVKINKYFIEKNKLTIHIGKYLKNGTIDLNNAVVKINYYSFVYNEYINKLN